MRALKVIADTQSAIETGIRSPLLAFARSVNPELPPQR
jgi:hypothetical protein